MAEPSSSSGLPISAEYYEVSATAVLLEGCAARLDLNATHLNTVNELVGLDLRVGRGPPGPPSRSATGSRA